MQESVVKFPQHPDSKKWYWCEKVGGKTKCESGGDGFVRRCNAERDFIEHQQRMARVAFRRDVERVKND